MRARTLLPLFTLALVACAGRGPDLSLDGGSSEPTIETPPRDLPSLDVPVAPDHDDPPVAPVDEQDHHPPKYEADPAPLPKLLPTELDDLHLPDVASPAPTEAEWVAAKRLRTTSFDCKARVVREWITIVCSLGVAGAYPFGMVRVLAGDPKDVGTWTWNSKRKEDDAVLESFVAAVFPVRRGDRRILEITFQRFGAKPTFDRAAAFTVSELWLDGMESPEISVTR